MTNPGTHREVGDPKLLPHRPEGCYTYRATVLPTCTSIHFRSYFICQIELARYVVGMIVTRACDCEDLRRCTLQSFPILQARHAHIYRLRSQESAVSVQLQWCQRTRRLELNDQITGSTHHFSVPSRFSRHHLRPSGRAFFWILLRVRYPPSSTPHSVDGRTT